MGGQGSGRKSVKGEAIKCLLNVQTEIIDLIYSGFDSNRSREELKTMAREIFNRIKVTLEEIERL